MCKEGVHLTVRNENGLFLNKNVRDVVILQHFL